MSGGGLSGGGYVWRGFCLEGFFVRGGYVKGVMSGSLHTYRIKYRYIGLMTPYASFGYKLPAPNVYFRHRLAEAMITHHISEDIVLSRPSLHLTPMTSPAHPSWYSVYVLCDVFPAIRTCLNLISLRLVTGIVCKCLGYMTIQQYQMLSDHLGMCQLY